MTYEEARDICSTIVSAEINELCNLYRHDDAQELEEAKNLMLSAFVKQIPRKPIKTIDFGSCNYCPWCGGLFDRTTKFCDICGQALDWSDFQ